MGHNVSSTELVLRAIGSSWAALASAAFTLWAAYIMVNANGFSWVVGLWLLWGFYWTMKWAVQSMEIRIAKANLAAAQEEHDRSMKPPE